MDPRGQKSILGQKIESSIFRPKCAQKCCLEFSNRFLVEKLKFHIFDQKWTLKVKNQFLVKNRKFNLSTKICPNGDRRSLIYFWSKNNNLIFFLPKWTLEVKNRFLFKKSKVQSADQKLTKNGA